MSWCLSIGGRKHFLIFPPSQAAASFLLHVALTHRASVSVHTRAFITQKLHQNINATSKCMRTFCCVHLDADASFWFIIGVQNCVRIHDARAWGFRRPWSTQRTARPVRFWCFLVDICMCLYDHVTDRDGGIKRERKDFKLSQWDVFTSKTCA